MRSENWYDEPEYLQNPLSKQRYLRDIEGLDYTDREPGPPTAPPLREMPTREFSPEEERRMYESWEAQDPPVARNYRDMLPTVSDEMYGRSLRGSERYTRDEVCRGYRRL